MTDRVFEDAIAFEVSAKYSAVEFYLYEDRSVKIDVKEEDGWNSQRAIFNLTAEEATQLKNFLIKSGY